jgi:hypothetical protein
MACPALSRTMKQALLFSSLVQGGAKRRMGVMIAPFPLCAESDAQPCWGGASLWAKRRSRGLMIWSVDGSPLDINWRAVGWK